MQAGEPSHTARGAAAYRAMHQTLESGAIFSDPFASKILDDETLARLDETAADPSLRPMRLFIAARSRFPRRRWQPASPAACARLSCSEPASIRFSGERQEENAEGPEPPGQRPIRVKNPASQ